MSLLRNYTSRRNSSLTRFSPVNSPIRKIFKPTRPLSLNSKLSPIDIKDLEHEGLKEKKEQEQSKDDSQTTENGKNDGKKKEDPKKKKDEEPICDLDPVPAANTNKVHANTQLPELPALPSPGSKDFASILQKKINLIQIQLDWKDSEGDVEAKEIRLNTINELLNVVQNSFDKLSADDKDTIYNGINKILFMDLAPVQKEYLFCDDLVVLSDANWDQTKILYQILTVFALASPKNNLMNLLFRQFNKYDLNERNNLLDIITQLIDKDPSLVPSVLKRCCNMISAYLDNATHPYVLTPTVTLIASIFKKSNDVSQYEKIYMNFILPLLGALHFPLCSDPMNQIIEQFVKGSQSLVMPTITELVRHFPRTRSVKTIAFLKMLTTAMTKMNTRNFRQYMKPLFGLFVKCTVGPQVKVSDASLSIWHRIELEPLIMDNAKVIFPFVYPILSKGMREVWSNDIINNIDDIFQTMNRIDSFIFQELCRQKQPQQPPQNDHLKMWATIARGAAKTDRNLNLATKLAEIQRIFAFQQPPQLAQTQSRNSSNSKLTGIQGSQQAKRSGSAKPLPPFKPT